MQPIDPTVIMADFYGQVAVHLRIYVVTLASTVALFWIAASATRHPTLVSAAMLATLAGGGLGYAGTAYSRSLPARLAADQRAYRLDAGRAVLQFKNHYGAAHATPRFLRLAALWGTLIVIAAVAAALVNQPAARGAALAIGVLASITLLLDVSAWRRDLAYAAMWTRVSQAAATSS